MKGKIIVCLAIAILALPLSIQAQDVVIPAENQAQPAVVNQNATLEPNINPNAVEETNVPGIVEVTTGDDGAQNEIVVPPAEQEVTEAEAEAVSPIEENVIIQDALQNLEADLQADQASAENQVMAQIPATQLLSLLINAANGTLSLVGLQVLAQEAGQPADQIIDLNDHKYLDMTTGVLFNLNQFQEALGRMSQAQEAVVAPEAQPQAQEAVVAPEAQPQAQEAVVAPEAQPQAQEAVVAPPAQEAVVTPPAQEVVVAPEAQPQTQENVVAPTPA